MVKLMAKTITRKPILFRGNKEIAAACGLPFKEINVYVQKHGLPAFKVNGHGLWLAFEEDLTLWLKAKRDEQLKK